MYGDDYFISLLSILSILKGNGCYGQPCRDAALELRSKIGVDAFVVITGYFLITQEFR